MPDLISLKSMRYRHRALRPGVPFSVPSDVEAALLKRALVAADPMPDWPLPVAVEDEPEKGPARPKVKRKPLRYQRRDMRADD